MTGMTIAGLTVPQSSSAVEIAVTATIPTQGSGCVAALDDAVGTVQRVQNCLLRIAQVTALQQLCADRDERK